jgi:hypothetical protein
MMYNSTSNSVVRAKNNGKPHRQHLRVFLRERNIRERLSGATLIVAG